MTVCRAAPGKHKYKWVGYCPGNPSAVMQMGGAVWPCMQPCKSVFWPRVGGRGSDPPPHLQPPAGLLRCFLAWKWCRGCGSVGPWQWESPMVLVALAPTAGKRG